MDFNELRRMATDITSNGPISTQERKITVRKRALAIKKYALVRSDGKCEACNEPAPFYTPEGYPFLEVHHLKRLSDGGLDLPENVAAVCPNCHRRVHFSSDGHTYNESLIQSILTKEKHF
ncbi:HNH endonuclease signature motif containing protein [Bacillus sp. BA3]|uniref:HNH endonuclease n=1 Tax=Bacillus sp. BA3 TaxID=2057910 RepID=UPI001922733C|nr:HNH endonuclease signature motif containing protein [Bacillus sp. BA3]